MLAVKALQELLQRESLAAHSNQLDSANNDNICKTIQLVIAGGYDTRVTENVEYFDEIKQFVDENKLSNK